MEKYYLVLTHVSFRLAEKCGLLQDVKYNNNS